ncbi:MAG: PKD domain-containing protein, partial [Sphingobacteriaceae bacterium]|nr:PKD domain-containing protein [Sphingobacteriaceae bacterium]
MKKLYFALLVFLSVFTANSALGQSISINYFDSAAKYAPGSGVALQLGVTGVFDRTNNRFELQLSDASGSFTNALTLTSLAEFYTSTITGVLPTTLVEGNYKLRVIGTHPNTISDTTAFFQVVSGTISAIPSINFSVKNPDILCLEQKYFGYLNASSTDKSIELEATIPNYSTDKSTYDFKAGLFVFYPSYQKISDLTISTFGSIIIPSGLNVGNYSVEIKKTIKASGVSTINSYIYQFNTQNTSLGNNSSESICTGSTYTMNVNIDDIKTNYPGSYYKFDFGDGTIVYKTHAELIDSAILRHQYITATCDDVTYNKNGSYIVKVDLFNKGIVTNPVTPNTCNVYSINGGGKSANVKVSVAAQANFTGPNNACLNSSVTFNNTSIAGKFNTTTGCGNDYLVLWKIKYPNSSDFQTIPPDFGWYNNPNRNLVIPINELYLAGVYQIKLEVSNVSGCNIVSSVIRELCVENPAVASFDFLYASQVVPNNSTICVSSNVINLKNKSNTLVPPSPCSNATYLWTVTPSAGVTISSPTDIEPSLTFSTPGTYNVKLSVTNVCGTVDTTKTITMVGPPSISNYSGTVSYCDALPKQIDFAPTYNANFAKAADLTYTWTVTGTGITSADYEYTGGTTASSANPKIIFKKYGTYAVKVVFTNGCGSAEATKTYIFNQPLQASITANTSATDITVCPSTPINLNALINGPPGYTYVWTKTAGAGSLSANNILNPVYTPSLADNGQQITFTLTVTYPGTVPSPCTSPLTKTIKVTYVANNTAANTTLARCSGTTVGFTPVSTVSGSQFTWTIKSIGPNITGANASATFGPGPINDVLVNTGTAIETVVYEISAKSVGGCVGTSFTLTVTVYPPITGNVISANQTICANQIPAALGQDASSTLGGGNLTTYLYAWEQNVGAGPWTTISGATSADYQPGALTNTMIYRRTVWSPDLQSCVNVSNEITVTVNPLPIVTLGTVTAVCNSETSFLLPYSAAQNTPTKYSISVGIPAMPGFVPVVDADLGTSPLSISIPSGLAQNNYVFVFTVKNANGCISSSQTFTVPIKSPPTP